MKVGVAIRTWSYASTRSPWKKNAERVRVVSM